MTYPHNVRASKYGEKLGSVTDMAAHYRGSAGYASVFLYGKQRNVLAYERVVMLKNLRQPVEHLIPPDKDKFLMICEHQRHPIKQKCRTCAENCLFSLQHFNYCKKTWLKIDLKG